MLGSEVYKQISQSQFFHFDVLDALQLGTRRNIWVVLVKVKIFTKQPITFNCDMNLLVEVRGEKKSPTADKV